MEVIPLGPDTRQLAVSDQSQIGDARRTVGALARALGFDETRLGQAEIVASELATNLWLHGHGGYLLLRT
nr:ATP-binding protein [Planctomycetota bacterium]